MTELQTSKSDFNETQIIASPAPKLLDGDVLLAIEHFAFTANNITYAVMGEKLRYWQFFPPHGTDPDQWGLIPVWGFARVTESRNDHIHIGERLFGYLPPADLLKIRPEKISSTSLIDGSAHRADLPPSYNMYRRVDTEAATDSTFDQERMLLSPLYITAFCLHDMLQSNNWFAAEQIVIGSASSKTSIGLAYALIEDPHAPTSIGLTSTRNLPQVETLGLYEQTVAYDQLSAIDATKPTVIVDMSANGEMLGSLHQHLGDNMKFCSNVGLTHWQAQPPGAGFIAERSEMFFAPGHIQQRVKDWGRQGFEQRSADFFARTASNSRSWLKMTTINGLQGLDEIYPAVCSGQIPADQGLIVQL